MQNENQNEMSPADKLKKMAENSKERLTEEYEKGKASMQNMKDKMGEGENDTNTEQKKAETSSNGDMMEQ